MDDVDEEKIRKLTVQVIEVFKQNDIEDAQEVMGTLMYCIFTLMPILNPEYKSQLSAAKALREILNGMVIQLEFEDITKS